MPPAIRRWRASRRGWPPAADHRAERSALHGEADGVGPVAGVRRSRPHFTGRYERRVFPRAGHNPPQEAPEAFARAVLDLG